MMKIILAVIASIFLFTSQAFAQEESFSKSTTYQGTVTAISKTQELQDPVMGKLIYQTITVKLSEKEVEIVTGALPEKQQRLYKRGDRVVVLESITPAGESLYQVNDYVRTTQLLVLFVIFIGLSILVGGWKGVTSIFGLGISFLLLFYVMLPLLLAGYNPLLVVIGVGLVIMAAPFYLSHGFTHHTSVALAGTAVSIVCCGVIGAVFVGWAKLSGFASEEAMFLSLISEDFQFKGLLLAGIIIGTLGVLDDVTISQAAIVQELKYANVGLSRVELFRRAMNVGREHIASLVNTLVLVYTASALPLFLLFTDSSVSLINVLNYEIVAQEIVTMLVGSIGLILAVPVTTYLASAWLPAEGLGDTHRHIH